LPGRYVKTVDGLLATVDGLLATVGRLSEGLARDISHIL
jgi:hypothetical protein